MNAKSQSGWYVYMVQCSDQSLYTGIAIDVVQRVAYHNAGAGARYTRSRRPVQLVYSEPAADKGAALRREAEIKRLSASKKRELIVG